MNADLFEKYEDVIVQFEVMITMLGYRFDSYLGNKRKFLDISNDSDVIFFVEIREEYFEVSEGLLFDTGFEKDFNSCEVKFETLDEALRVVLKYL